MTLRTFNYGGGVQSTAALVLAAQGKIDYPIFLFSNVGEDSEHPATLAYVREVAMPFAESNGIAIEELHRIRRNGERATLYDQLVNGSERTIDIPARMAGSGAPGRRNCTGSFKIKVVAKWQKQHGATDADPAMTGLGISLDEFQRARTESAIKWQRLDYPLITMRLSRQDCRNIIERAGIPVPPKSSCYFCPFRTLAAWQRQRQDEPELFEKSAKLEALLSERNEKLGRGPVFFSSRQLPLYHATSPHRQLSLFDEAEDSCESGYCMT